LLTSLVLTFLYDYVGSWEINGYAWGILGRKF